VDPQTDLPSSPQREPSGPDAGQASASDSAASGMATAGDGAAERGGGFLANTVEELRKVVWPSRQQLFGESVAVILMVTLSAFAIAAVDRFYSWGNSQVFR
jgi:preprotein translocase subunit SecE